MTDFLDQVKSTREDVPRRAVVYGPHGIGKSTFASKWPEAIVIPTEDGLAHLDVAAFPRPKTYLDVRGCIEELFSKEHPYKTVVIDSADWLEQLIHKKVAENNDKRTVADIDYGKGYVESANIFRQILGGLDACRRKHGMHVVLVAHSKVEKFERPDGDSYDRYVPSLDKRASALIQQWADEVLFCNYQTFTRKTDEGFGRSRAIATGGKRVMHTQERPAFLAKSRLDLPEEMSLDFEEFEPYLNGVVAK